MRNDELLLYATVAGIGGVLLWYIVKNGKEVGQTVGGAAVDVADGVLSGAVVGIGERLGVPATNKSDCQQALDEGRTWDASFACPAGDFLGYVFNR